MVLVYITNSGTATELLRSAGQLASQLGKDIGVCMSDNEEERSEPDMRYKKIDNSQQSFEALDELCEQNDVSFLFIQLSDNKSSNIKKLLQNCRNLRIPYLFFKDTFTELNMAKVFLPVNFLEEEMEKTQFASAFGRFCDSEIHILQANDYGSKAANNVNRMKEFFGKFSFSVNVEKAKSDSFKVDKEAVERAVAENAGIIIISASRDYGLDDLIFGPKEYHLIKKSAVPLLIVNPRGDLYTLCD